MTFPTYQWLTTLPSDNNYMFLIFGDYGGTHGILTYRTHCDFCPASLGYVIYDGRNIFDKKEYPFAEFAYNNLQMDFVKSHKAYVKTLLNDCSSTWADENGCVKLDCCIPF